ncbi:hypothetical protein WMY93_025900 [Mugilogobius chulae]|uniref:Uncharacterized protein n=1 Tax=Mugilogobius chulae TaxID=88201 RepID=A0AAW0MZG2_9GOBI
MYGSIFTAEFLQNVTRDRNLYPLQNCLLTTGTAVYRTPWKNVVNPLFVNSTADAIMQARSIGRGGFRGHLSTCSTSGSTGTLDSHLSSRESLHSQGTDSIFSEPNSPNGNHRQSCESKDNSPIINNNTISDGHEDGREKVSKSLSFSTDLSNPSPRRRLSRDSVTFESRRLFRKSYMEALQNPMALGSSSESILEESPEPSTSPTHRDRVSLSSNGPDLHCPREHLSRRQGGRGWLSGEDRPSTPLLYLQRGLRGGERRSDRRSKSLERTNKTGQVKGHRERSSSGGPGSISPKKLMNGYALRFGRLDVETAFHRSDRRGSKEDPAQHDVSSESRRRKLSVEEAAGPKSPANGTAVRLSSTSSCAPVENITLPTSASEVNQELLMSGAIILPGNQDRGGGPCCRRHLFTGLLPLHAQKREAGAWLTVVVDGRRQQPSALLLSSLSELQMLIPNALYIVLLLVDKETAAKPERDFAVQTEVLSSLKALQKYIDQTQLTRDLDGSFSYDHNHWINFRQKIEPFVSSCHDAISSLQQSISMLANNSSLKTAKEVSEVMERQKQLMKCVLDDTSLNKLRLEGGTVLARIKKEEVCDNENYRETIEILNTLYNQVDEEVHKLVILSNKAQKQLESVFEVCKFEEQTNQIKLWFSVEGEKHLTSLDQKL